MIRAGLEPVVAAVKERCPIQLDERTMCREYLPCESGNRSVQNQDVVKGNVQQRRKPYQIIHCRQRRPSLPFVDSLRGIESEGSLNIPLQNMQAVKSSIPALDKPIYVHCLSGSRSAQAVSVLKSMGYTNVTNIGGINAYHGKVVK